MRKNIFQIAMSAAAAVVISLVFVLIFTLIIQLFSLPLGAVKPVNQVFKIVAIAAGGLIFIRGEKGLISCSFDISWFFAIEILIGAVAGAITGVIAVNIKNKA